MEDDGKGGSAMQRLEARVSVLKRGLSQEKLKISKLKRRSASLERTSSSKISTSMDWDENQKRTLKTYVFPQPPSSTPDIEIGAERASRTKSNNNKDLTYAVFVDCHFGNWYVHRSVPDFIELEKILLKKKKPEIEIKEKLSGWTKRRKAKRITHHVLNNYLKDLITSNPDICKYPEFVNFLEKDRSLKLAKDITTGEKIKLKLVKETELRENKKIRLSKLYGKLDAEQRFPTKAQLQRQQSNEESEEFTSPFTQRRADPRKRTPDKRTARKKKRNAHVEECDIRASALLFSQLEKGFAVLQQNEDNKDEGSKVLYAEISKGVELLKEITQEEIKEARKKAKKRHEIKKRLRAKERYVQKKKIAQQAQAMGNTEVSSRGSVVLFNKLEKGYKRSQGIDTPTTWDLSGSGIDNRTSNPNKSDHMNISSKNNSNSASSANLDFDNAGQSNREESNSERSNSNVGKEDAKSPPLPPSENVVRQQRSNAVVEEDPNLGMSVSKQHNLRSSMNLYLQFAQGFEKILETVSEPNLAKDKESTTDEEDISDDDQVSAAHLLKKYYTGKPGVALHVIDESEERIKKTQSIVTKKKSSTANQNEDVPFPGISFHNVDKEQNKQPTKVHTNRKSKELDDTQDNKNYKTQEISTDKENQLDDKTKYDNNNNNNEENKTDNISENSEQGNSDKHLLGGPIKKEIKRVSSRWSGVPEEFRKILQENEALLWENLENFENDLLDSESEDDDLGLDDNDAGPYSYHYHDFSSPSSSSKFEMSDDDDEIVLVDSQMINNIRKRNAKNNVDDLDLQLDHDFGNMIDNFANDLLENLNFESDFSTKGDNSENLQIQSDFGTNYEYENLQMQSDFGTRTNYSYENLQIQSDFGTNYESENLQMQSDFGRFDNEYETLEIEGDFGPEYEYESLQIQSDFGDYEEENLQIQSDFGKIEQRNEYDESDEDFNFGDTFRVVDSDDGKTDKSAKKERSKERDKEEEEGTPEYREPEQWEKNLICLEEGKWSDGMEDAAFGRWRRDRKHIPSLLLFGDQKIIFETPGTNDLEEIKKDFDLEHINLDAIDQCDDFLVTEDYGELTNICNSTTSSTPLKTKKPKRRQIVSSAD